MNKKEIATVVALVSAGQSREFTDADMDIWFDLLGDLDGKLAYESARELVKTTDKYITPSDIRAQANKVAKERIARVGLPAAPPDMSAEEYQKWLREHRALAVSGNADGALALDASRQLGAAQAPSRPLNFDFMKSIDDDPVEGEIVDG